MINNMKKTYLKIGFFVLIITLINSTITPASSVVDTSKIGVKVGDTRTWEITKWVTTGEFVGFLGEITKGDTFNVEIVSLDLDSENSIEIKSVYPDGTEHNDRIYLGDIFDSDLVFMDWPHWKTVVEAAGHTVVEDNDTFERSYSATDTYIAGSSEYDYFDYVKEETSGRREYDKSTGFMNNLDVFLEVTYINGSTSMIDASIITEGSDISSSDVFLSGIEFTSIFITMSVMIIPIILKRRKQLY